MAATEVPTGLQLMSLDGQTRPIDEWLITFQLLGVVLDPYTYESSWILDTASRILQTYRGASVRTSFFVTCTPDEAKQFLGPLVDQVIVFCDPDRAFVRACGLDELPALVHIRQNRQLAGVAQGWQPEEWRTITHAVSRERRWTRPVVPSTGDPSAYRGSPALGEPAPA